jgi:hypothetical protein
LVSLELPPKATESRIDHVTRDCIYRRVRDLARLYSLGWLLLQETMHVQAIMEQLPDEELLDLLARMEQARECLIDGVSFDDAGLVRQRIAV